MLMIFILGTSALQAAGLSTQRIEQLSNARVTVWKTIIYPSSKQVLPMHRHDNDRVLVALTDGTLKITNNKGKVHYLKLKKGKAYYLTKDVPDELHNDENVTNHPIQVMVIQLNDKA
ncbi:TPA: hypothetical protein JA359_11355 [Legionella pneumophila]|nr:hypothetical protein [Legionella pneumophila]